MVEILRNTLIFTAWTGGLLLLIAVWRRWHLNIQARDRVDEALDAAEIENVVSVDEPGLLRRWLMHAGFRKRSGPATFVGAQIVAVGLGICTAVIILWSGLAPSLLSGLEIVPGGFGDLFLPAVYIGPWFFLLFFGCLPFLFVRRNRRQRVEQLEQDLPIALDLMATLSEAGLGFDAVLSRLVQTRISTRPLGQEIRTFQADLLAGRSRVHSLRRLARRAEVPAMTLLVSSLVQAEQLGMGLANVLRRMAEDMRHRRREKANAFAASLPVKLMLPLIACFLPGVFIWTLGPIFSHFFKLTDSIIQTGTL